jgi:hypothetical protein
MASLAKSQNLPPHTVQGFGSTEFGGILLIPNLYELYNYTLNNPNQTHLAIQFTSACELWFVVALLFTPCNVFL